MEINKELGPFKIHISLDGLTPEEEQWTIDNFKCKLDDMKFLGFPVPFSDHYSRTTYRVPNNNIANYLSRTIHNLNVNEWNKKYITK